MLFDRTKRSQTQLRSPADFLAGERCARYQCGLVRSGGPRAGAKHGKRHFIASDDDCHGNQQYCGSGNGGSIASIVIGRLLLDLNAANRWFRIDAVSRLNMYLISAAAVSCILVIPSSAGCIPMRGNRIFENANDSQMAKVAAPDTSLLMGIVGFLRPFIIGK